MTAFEKNKRIKAAAVIGIVLILAAAAALSTRTGYYLTLRNRDTKASELQSNYSNIVKAAV